MADASSAGATSGGASRRTGDRCDPAGGASIAPTACDARPCPVGGAGSQGLLGCPVIDPYSPVAPAAVRKACLRHGVMPRATTGCPDARARPRPQHTLGGAAAALRGVDPHGAVSGSVELVSPQPCFFRYLRETGASGLQDTRDAKQHAWCCSVLYAAREAALLTEIGVCCVAALVVPFL